jgi:CRP/FNR family transcriptional regulator, cyclic AMP receptor protein
MARQARTSLEDARRLLAGSVLFRGLVAGERDALVARARLRHYAPGETIFLMGGPGDSMMAVLSGTVWVSVGSPEGKEIVLAIIQAGEVFGEITLLDGRERTADARAMTACDLAVLDRRDVLDFLERQPDAWPRLVEVLCERLRATDQLMAEVAMQQLPARLARALLRVLDSQSSDEQGAAVTIRLRQREIGNIVGAARESVNKCLREWQRTGLVRVEGRTITIPNRSNLEDVARIQA